METSGIIYKSKQCENEVHIVSGHIDIEVLCCSEYLIFIWNWDIKVIYVSMPISYMLRTTYICCINRIEDIKAVNVSVTW